MVKLEIRLFVLGC